MNATELRELRNLVEGRFDRLYGAVMREQQERRKKARKQAKAEIKKLDKRFEKRLSNLIEAAEKAIGGTPNVVVRYFGTSEWDWDEPQSSQHSLFRIDPSLDVGESAVFQRIHDARTEAREQVSMMAFEDSAQVKEFLDSLPTVDDMLGKD